MTHKDDYPQRITPAELGRMVGSSSLLPDPGGEVVRRLAAEIRAAWAERDAAHGGPTREWGGRLMEAPGGRVHDERERCEDHGCVPYAG